MRTKTYTALAGFSMLLAASLSMPAGANTTMPAWQDSGYVMDVVIAKAPRQHDTTLSIDGDDADAVTLPKLADVEISTGSDRELREQAARAVRETLSAIQISLEELVDQPQNRESVL